MIFDRNTQKVEIKAFATYSKALFGSMEGDALVEKDVDYSEVEFSTNPDSLRTISTSLG